MRFFSVFALVVIFAGFVRSEEFEIGQVIHPIVEKMAEPKLTEGFAQVPMAITTSSEYAAKHFALGLAKFNTSWDFEAYRHFCHVVKLDPECLMGYWGISLSLARGNHEFFSQRKAAIDRMLDLLEKIKEGDGSGWNPLEKGFAQATGLLLTDGQRVAGKTFQGLAKKYPANIQAHLLSLSLQRDGFDRFGRPQLGQRRAVDGIRKLLEQHPDNPSVMVFWINTMCQDPGGVKALREEVLPVARSLASKNPDYAPYQLLLAQVESRCGNAKEGLKAATKALELYRTYQKSEGVSIYDCDGVIRAQLFQADLLFLLGKQKEAFVIAKELAGLKVEEERVYSKGAVMLMWEGRTLGARLSAAKETPKDFLLAQEMLGLLKEEEWFKEKSYALRYRNCLGYYFIVRGAVADGKEEVAKKLYTQFLERVRMFEETRPLASKTSSFTNWLRAMKTTGMMVFELRGLVAELGKGATKETAGTWYRSALDRQDTPVNLLPPVFPYPVQLRLASHYAGLEKYTESASWYLKGLERRPNHPVLLNGLSKVADKLGKTEKAASLQKQIEGLTK
ncbi:MAG: tetratricopeptide repeat protein [Akkermansiaceae bacterium]